MNKINTNTWSKIVKTAKEFEAYRQHSPDKLEKEFPGILQYDHVGRPCVNVGNHVLYWTGKIWIYTG